MRSGQVSRTALNVAAAMVTLGAKPGWRERLPAGLPELSEALLLVSGQFPFTDQALRLSRQPWAVGLADLGEVLQPGTFEGLGRRKIYMDEQVVAAISAGASQVLVLGAGFDTLCLRLATEYPHLSFLEIDHPDTSRVKASALETLGRPSNLELIEADFTRLTLSQVLQQTENWDRSAVGVVVAEGLLYYLSRSSVNKLFGELRANAAPGSRVAFSHLPSLRHHRLARAALRIGGEPWLSASTTENLTTYIGSGWKIIHALPARWFRDLEGLAVAELVSAGKTARRRGAA